jgi:tRNA-Thr(GGU) m(6)t(6)A37 methyltransferase TsaA
MSDQELFHIHPIGRVTRSDGGVFIQIDAACRPALHMLDHFSHVLVFWWADWHDNPQSRAVLQTRPPYVPDEVVGVFATRAEYRPNPIAMTVCRIIAVDEAAGAVQVANIDAYDDSPVLDLKAYYPVCDRVRDVQVPVWAQDWPEWLPDEGLGLEEE